MMFRSGDRTLRTWQENGAIKMMETTDVMILHFGLHYVNDTLVGRCRLNLSNPC
jgi:hypothetical protein